MNAETSMLIFHGFQCMVGLSAAPGVISGQYIRVSVQKLAALDTPEVAAWMAAQAQQAANAGVHIRMVSINDKSLTVIYGHRGTAVYEYDA
jgi:hypothetical protein